MLQLMLTLHITDAMSEASQEACHVLSEPLLGKRFAGQDGLLHGTPTAQQSLMKGAASHGCATACRRRQQSAAAVGRQ